MRPTVEPPKSPGKRLDRKTYENLVSESIEELSVADEASLASRQEAFALPEMLLMRKRWFKLLVAALVANVLVLYYFRFSKPGTMTLDEANRQLATKYSSAADPIRVFKHLKDPVRACTDAEDPLVLGTLDRLNMSLKAMSRSKADPLPADKLLSDSHGVYWCDNPQSCLSRF